jgi:hypothetical protein
MTLDVRTGERTQLTHLPAATSPIPVFPATGFASFLDDRTIAFASAADPDGLNPGGQLAVFTIRTDGTGLHVFPLPAAAALAGSRVVPVFEVAGGPSSVHPITLSAPGVPVNASAITVGVLEVYVVDGRNVLQLTNFRRADTFTLFQSPRGKQIFFEASGDPLRINPNENCQLFSIDVLGGRLRQLTHFGDGNRSTIGCLPGPPPGCSFDFPASVAQDRLTGTLIFESSCDPLGTNPHGNQIFAMRPDGSGLRQLTHTRGFVTEADGSVVVELPGPVEYAIGR